MSVIRRSRYQLLRTGGSGALKIFWSSSNGQRRLGVGTLLSYAQSSNNLGLSVSGNIAVA
jgi:hypothetical protein